jgi:3-isopropylmalate dehydrogenase
MATSSQNKVNPLATILAAKMMLEWLGEKDEAVAMERAVATVIKEGKTRTYDMGGSNSTAEMAAAVAAKI